MPDIRKRKPRPYYTVFALRYATSEDRDKLSRGDIPAFTSSIVHSGTSEAMALRAFGRACIQQTNDPLAYSVTLQRDREVIADVTLRQELKPHGFFGLSSVGGALRSAAWPRLGEYRSGGGKARKHGLHADPCFLGGAMPVDLLMPPTKGKMAHSLRSASWRRATPTSFEAQSLGTCPQGWRLFLWLFSRWLLFFLKPWIGYPCLQNST